MMGRKALVLLVVTALVAGEVEAAVTLTVTRVDRSEPGVVRIAVSYDGGGTPSFRLTPTCSPGASQEWVVASVVRVTPADKGAVLELRDLPWLTMPCQAHGLTVEMLNGSRVVARAEVPLELHAPRALTVDPPPPRDVLLPRLGVLGYRLRAPQTKMSEAGITWAVSNRVTLDLSYERTAYPALMPNDHDDGVLTGVKIGF